MAPDVAVKTDPRLWARSKSAACNEAGLCPHSARKMQWATQYYKRHGGGYAGPRSGANKLRKWTRERWRTASGAPSRGRRRYLPDAAWRALTPDQVRRTDAAKARGTRAGKQYVRQPSDVARVAARARRQDAYPWMPYAAAHAHEAEARARGVSEVARAPGGFMRAYARWGARLRSKAASSTLTWERKRHNFVARHMAQYAAHPTRRRWLALVMWAYRPPGPVPASV